MKSWKPRQLLGILVIGVASCLQAAPPGVKAPHFPSGLPVLEAPRGWGEDTFLPKSKTPARTVLAVPLEGLSKDERIAVCCLQGLLARDQPRIWLVRDNEDGFWMDWHRAKGHVERFETVTSLPELFQQFRATVKGAIVPDEQLFRGDLLALNVAACEDLIVASPALAERLCLPVTRDLRGRFKTYAEGLAWVWETYQTKLDPHLCDFRCPSLLPFGTFDYSYQWRALMFWVAGPKEENKPGVDRSAEHRIAAQILAAMPVNGVCLGFPAMGEGEGMGEPPGMELLSRYGKSLVCNNHGRNYSILSGIRIETLTPPLAPAPPALAGDKIYVALVMSDGDNQILWPAFFRRYFEHPAFGTFPLAFGIGPAIRELQPGLAQWYYEHAQPTTEFIADVSGAGYMQPDHFAEAYVDRERIWTGFLQWTRRLMEPLGLQTIRTVGGSDANVTRYAGALPCCHSIFADMGRYSGRSGIASLSYALPGGMPVFRAVTSWRYGKDGFLREIREQVGTQRPAFVNGFVHCWTFAMDDLVRIHQQRDPDMVFVTPSQLAKLFGQALQTGRTQSKVDAQDSKP